MVVLLVGSSPSPSSSLYLGAVEEEAMVVVLVGSAPSSVCLVRLRRRPWLLCWWRPFPHSAWCV
jgi:hypothetical protein